MPLDLSKIKTIYFIGIKGVAMTGLAVICKRLGLKVSGSDVPEKFITDKILDREKIEVFENFSADNLKSKPDLVVIGASWDEKNIEVAEAARIKIPSISDSKFRGILSKMKRTIAVTGVHGKTTTTALLSFVFSRAGLEPSFLIGTGTVPDLKGNADWSGGKHFIVEGDEYIGDQKNRQPKFLDLDPAVSLITSLEWEHVDVFPDLESLEKVFQKLIEKTKDLTVACGDWPSIRKIISSSKKNIITYGLDKGNDYQAYDLIQEFDQTTFKVRSGKKELGQFQISLFGEHNVLNALAVIIGCLNEGLKIKTIKNILPNFKGSERRFDVSERRGVTFIDDYAHHPTEIKKTLEAVRHRYPKQKIWCVFQPHMASRTKALFDDFTKSFSDVDSVIFADIFASAREKAIDVTAEELAEKTKEVHPDSVYAGDLNQTINYLKDKIKPGMVLVTMGAGDVYRVRDKLLMETGIAD